MITNAAGHESLIQELWNIVAEYAACCVHCLPFSAEPNEKAYSNGTKGACNIVIPDSLCEKELELEMAMWAPLNWAARRPVSKWHKHLKMGPDTGVIAVSSNLFEVLGHTTPAAWREILMHNVRFAQFDRKWIAGTPLIFMQGVKYMNHDRHNILCAGGVAHCVTVLADLDMHLLVCDYDMTEGVDFEFV